jgi:hypothetical protein
MAFLLAGLLVFGVLYLGAQGIAGADPRDLLRGIRFGVGGIFVAAGVVLSIGREIGFGIPLIGIGLTLLVTGRLGPIDLRGGGAIQSEASQSSVSTDWLDMRLDHDSRTMSGKVTQGEFAGRRLETLDRTQLLRLAAEIGSGNDSAALLEAYLDRRFPDRREDVKRDGDTRARGAANAGAMTDEEAYQVLGLLPGAGEAEIRAAHRRLMKALHPDQGGSTFLAAKINQAKDRLLNDHR